MPAPPSNPAVLLGPPLPCAETTALPSPRYWVKTTALDSSWRSQLPSPPRTLQAHGGAIQLVDHHDQPRHAQRLGQLRVLARLAAALKARLELALRRAPPRGRDARVGRRRPAGTRDTATGSRPRHACRRPGRLVACRCVDDAGAAAAVAGLRCAAQHEARAQSRARARGAGGPPHLASRDDEDGHIRLACALHTHAAHAQPCCPAVPHTQHGAGHPLSGRLLLRTRFSLPIPSPHQSRSTAQAAPPSLPVACAPPPQRTWIMLGT
jgi:hypothetical protein